MGRLDSRVDQTNWCALLAWIFFLSLHSFESFPLFWALAGGKVQIVFVEMAEEFSWLAWLWKLVQVRRPSTSASASASATVGPPTPLGEWWLFVAALFVDCVVGCGIMKGSKMLCRSLSCKSSTRKM